MKLALLFTLATITSYTFPMDSTITLPDTSTLKQQLQSCYYNPNLLTPILQLANKEVRAARIKAAIDASVHQHIKTVEFDGVVALMFACLELRGVSLKDTRVLAIKTKTADVTDQLLQKFPEMHAAVRMLQNTQN
jgi:hypothetical protein